MNNISDFLKCANCGACYNICPVGAISINKDTLFYELIVNEDLCINCGKCKKVCPVNTPKERNVPKAAYGAINYNSSDVLSSSSGGVFSAIANEILSRGGVVFGAAYDSNFRSVKICSSEQTSLDALKVSKYVESEVQDSFQQAKHFLEQSREVLYCGAPCQIAGLKRYLGKEYDKLLTCDFSCGGFPSHKIYGEYLDEICSRLGTKELIEVNFRPKIYGWNNHAIKIRAKNRRKYIRYAGADHYFDLFMGGHRKYSVREYCLECEFGENHFADIILADFWKHKSLSNISNDNKGISLVIANSEKGEKIISSLSKDMAITTIELESACYNLKCNHFSAENYVERNRFLDEFKKEGFLFAVKGHKLKSQSFFWIKYKIKKILGKTQG